MSDFREMNYVLAIAKYQNITKAAPRDKKPRLTSLIKPIATTTASTTREIAAKFILYPSKYFRSAPVSSPGAFKKSRVLFFASVYRIP